MHKVNAEIRPAHNRIICASTMSIGCGGGILRRSSWRRLIPPSCSRCCWRPPATPPEKGPESRRSLLAAHSAPLIAAGVWVAGFDGALRPANGRDFRHGAAANRVRQGVPLGEVQQQLGHARIATRRSTPSWPRATASQSTPASSGSGRHNRAPLSANTRPTPADRRRARDSSGFSPTFPTASSRAAVSRLVVSMGSVMPPLRAHGGCLR